MILRFLIVICGAALIGLSACAQSPDWQLLDANRITPGKYVILTVPEDDPQALYALAAEIGNDFGLPFAAEWPLNAIRVHCLVYDATNVPDIDALLAAMRADDRIRTAQPVQDFATSASAYSDPLFRLQTSLEQMNAPKAHLVSKGAGIRIGVIDSAIDREHSDLRDRVADARDFVSASPMSLAEMHGTAVAGVIAASADNAMGIVGVAPEAELVGLRACWQAPGQSGRCNSFSLARALNFAILNDTDVLNLSIGGPDDALLRELINAAIAKGMVIVAASGERAANAFPASMPGVIAAGQGRAGRIPAPMRDVITTAPTERHRYASGSSIATAHVSGVVALMLAQNADLADGEINARLANAIKTNGNGLMLDACAALSAGQPACVP